MSGEIVTSNVGLSILTTVKNYGIDTVFGIPGTHSVEFYRHFGALGIRAVTTRHEQGAGYGADGWSQLTGLPGVVITTAGPGLLNVMSAAATAYAESRPLLILSPGAPVGGEFSDKGVLHETKDPTGAMASIVSRSTRATSGRHAVELIHEAFAFFAHSRPRPIHIEVPLDILESVSEMTSEDCASRDFGPWASAEPTAIRAAAEALKGAVNPVIIAGGGAILAGDALRVLAEKLQAPVVTSLNGKAAVSEFHPLSLGANLRLRTVRDVCCSADVLLIVGSKVGEAELWGGVIDPPEVCVRVDIDATQMNTNMSADIQLVGDSRSVVTQLVDALGEYRSSEQRDLGELKLQLDAEARAIAPDLAEINEIIARIIPANTVISGDSSQVSYLGTATFIPQEKPHRFLYMPTYATLGYGLPAAIGAKIAAPELPVICILGDGALMFSVQEFITAVEQDLDITVVCLDNGGYREIRQNMVDRGIDPIGTVLRQPDWPALASAFGFTSFEANSVDRIADAVTAAMAVHGPSFVHVRLG